MVITTDDVLKALSTVEEPDLKRDLVSLHMVQEVKVSADTISFTIILTTPACPLKELIKKNCETAIRRDIPSAGVINIHLTSNVTSTRIGHTPMLPEVKNIIAVASGKGGVGKSTVTANLAIALSKSGASVGIIDADIFGPSIPLMFDVENEKPRVTQVNGRNMMVPVMQYGIKLMSIGFMAAPDTAVVWRGPMASSALKQFLGDTDWGPLDYLLIDLPPGTSDIHLTLVQSVPVTGVIIVTTPQKVALTDAQKGLAMFRQPPIDVPVLGIVENMSYFTPEELPSQQYFIFGKNGGKELAEKNNVPLLGQIPLVQGIRESGDAGRPAVLNNDVSAYAFKSFSEAVAQHVSIRNATLEQSKKVEIKI